MYDLKKIFFPITKKKIIYIFFTGCISIPLVCLMHLGTQVYRTTETLTTQVENSIHKIIKELDAIGNDIIHLKLSCQNSSVYLARAKKSKNYNIFNFNSQLLKLEFNDSEQSCTANSLGYTEKLIEKPSPFKPLKIVVEPITNLELIEFTYELPQPGKEAHKYISLSIPTNDFLAFIHKSISLDKKFLKIDIKITPESSLTSKVNVLWFRFLLEVFEKVILFCTALLGFKFLGHYILSVLERKHRKSISTLNRKLKISSQKVRTLNNIQESQASQQKLNKRISSDIHHNISEVISSIDALFLQKSCLSQADQMLVNNIYKKLVNILSLKINHDSPQKLDIYKILEEVISIHRDEALELNTKIRLLQNDSTLPDISMNEIRLNLIFSGVLGNLLENAAEDSYIEVEILHQKDHMNVTFTESNGFKKDIGCHHHANYAQGFANLSKPSFEAAKKVALAESCIINQDFVPNKGRVFVVCIPILPHKKELVSNVVQFKDA